jgi:hypothetical protein
MVYVCVCVCVCISPVETEAADRWRTKEPLIRWDLQTRCALQRYMWARDSASHRSDLRAGVKERRAYK